MASFALERLDFDPANPGDGPNLGAYLRAGDDGDLITSTQISSKEALDINIAGSDIDLTVDLDLDNLVADDAPDTEDPLKIGTRGHLQSSVLAALSDDGDKADGISDIYRRMWTTSAPNVGWVAATASVGTAAAQIDSSKQAGRQYVIVQNNGTKPMFIGPSGVTVSSGYEIGKGASVSLEFGEALDIFAISTAAGQDARVVQVG